MNDRVPQRLSFRAMGCGMSLVADGTGDRITHALHAVPARVARWERALSRFQPDSELARANNHPGRPTRVGASFLGAVSAALSAARWSHGLVTPTVLTALESAGYDRDFDGLPRDGTVSAGTPPVPVPDWRAITVDPGSQSVTVPPGVRLDLGGTAKGWTADRVAARLAPLCPTLVDAGGDMAITGPRPGGEPWTVRVADPVDPTQDVAVLHVDRGGVATSGRDHRRWQRNGGWQHHIIDPRTGAPAVTDVLTATVIAPSALEAEVAAKVVVILGSTHGMAWLDAHSTLAGLAVRDDRSVCMSPSLWAYLVDM